MKKINVAVIGTGNMGQHHVRVYSRIPQANLVAVCDQDIERAQKTARKYGCQSYQDYADMIHHEKIDAVSIAAPTFLHHKISTDLLRAGAHVLIEKPIATTLQEAREMIRLAKKKKRILMVGHIERFNPVITALQKLIKKGVFGEIISLSTKRVGGLPALVKNTNVLLDLSIHDIDISNVLLQSLPTKIMRMKLKSVLKEQEDQAIIVMKYKKTLSVIENNWITPVKIRTLDVTGTQAYARVDYIHQSIYLYKKNNVKSSNILTPPVKEIIRVKKGEPLKKELEHFLGCIRYNRIPETNGETSYNALKIALM